MLGTALPPVPQSRGPTNCCGFWAADSFSKHRIIFSKRERGSLSHEGCPDSRAAILHRFGKTMRTTSGTGSAAFIISSCLSTNSTTPFQFLVCFKGLYRHSKFFQWYVPHGFDLEFSSKSAIRLEARKIRKTKNVKCLFPAIETGFDALPACFTSSQDLADMHQHY